MTAQKLEIDFPRPDLSTWQNLVAKTLAGKPLDTLKHTLAGQVFEPIYSASERPSPSIDGTASFVAPLRVGDSLELARERADSFVLGPEWTLAQILDAGFKAGDTVRVHTDAATAKTLDEKIGWKSVVFSADVAGVANIDGAAWEQLGADSVVELAILAGGILDAARNGATEFNVTLALTPMVFESIAKRRALAEVFGRIQAWWGQALTLHVHGVTSARTFSLFDAHTNLLRTGCAAFAGLVAGVDTLTCLPHDWRCQNTSDGFRIALNIPHVLSKEAHLLRTFDAAGGSGYIDALTQSFAKAAWELVLELEAKDGLALGFEDLIRPRIDAARAARVKDLRTRKAVLVGVNDFVDALQIQPARAFGPAALPTEIPFEADEWEHVARRAQAMKVGIASLGEPKRHKARREYVDRLLRAGGFTPVDTAQDASPDVVFLCGHDDDYASLGIQEAKSLAPKTVVVAGRPGALEEAWRAAGVKDFVFMGADILAVLESMVEGRS
jgi:methylmalonyl-CoA mutase